MLIARWSECASVLFLSPVWQTCPSRESSCPSARFVPGRAPARLKYTNTNLSSCLISPKPLSLFSCVNFDSRSPHIDRNFKANISNVTPPDSAFTRSINVTEAFLRGKTLEPRSHQAHFQILFSLSPSAVSIQRQRGLMADGQMDGSIHIHSHNTSCLSCGDLSVRESVRGCQGEGIGLFEHPNKTSWSKIVTEGDELRDISSGGVKMADRCMAAGRKSVCASLTNLFGFVKQKHS